jgi:hypothetical protein
MTKRDKFFIFLIVIGLIFFVYIILSSEPTSNNKNVENNNVELQGIEDEYKTQLKPLVQEYKKIIAEDEPDIEAIKTTKDNLLALTVPTKYKDLHIKIALALLKMEEFIKEKDQLFKTESNNLINEALANNNWLEEE